MPNLPESLIAVMVFVAGGLFNAIVGAATAEYKARGDHRRQLEAGRITDSRAAAVAMLEEVDKIAEALRSRQSDGYQPLMEPHYRVLRRRSAELSSKRARDLMDEISDDLYYHFSTGEELGDISIPNWGHLLRGAARTVLGAEIRGEPVTEPEELVRLRPLVNEMQEILDDNWREEEERERSGMSDGQPDERESAPQAQRPRSGSGGPLRVLRSLRFPGKHPRR